MALHEQFITISLLDLYHISNCDFYVFRRRRSWTSSRNDSESNVDGVLLGGENHFNPFAVMRHSQRLACSRPETRIHSQRLANLPRIN